MEAQMAKILRPFEGLGDLKFDLPMKEVKQAIGVDESTVRNRHLKQETVVDGPTTYVFENGILVSIELKYQEGVYFNDVDIFKSQDIDGLLAGYATETKRKHIHVKEIGLILLSFLLKDRKKREIWFYSKEMIPEYDTFLDVV